MSTLKFQSNQSDIMAKIIRAITGLWGVMYITYFLSTYFNGQELTFPIIVQGVLGLGLLLAALLGTEIGNPKEIILSPDFIRTDEGSSYTRTAYWQKIERLKLSRLGIHITYQSGTPERFSLPFLNKTEFTELKERMQSKTDHHDISFSISPWWKLF